MTNFEKCKSCKHYQAFYIIRQARFVPFGGQCTCRELMDTRTKNWCRLQENCTYWEENPDVKKIRNESINNAIKDIKEHLRYIRCVLENEIGDDV